MVNAPGFPPAMYPQYQPARQMQPMQNPQTSPFAAQTTDKKESHTGRNLLIAAGTIAAAAGIGVLAYKGKLGDGAQKFTQNIVNNVKNGFSRIQSKLAGTLPASKIEKIETINEKKVIELAKGMKRAADTDGVYFINLADDAAANNETIQQILKTINLPKDVERKGLFALATMGEEGKKVIDFKILDCKNVNFTEKAAELLQGIVKLKF